MLLARRLNDARSRLSSMYATWGRYLYSITKLAQLFLFTPVRETFPAEAPPSVIQRDLAEVFQRILSVFSPLIVPVSTSMPPFSPSNENEANIVLEGFVNLLNSLPHNVALQPGSQVANIVLEGFVNLLNSLPHNVALQPGSQNIPSLIWQFYYEKLSTLSHGSTHYYAILEQQLVRIPWHSFFPSERGLAAMDDCLARAPLCAPFIAQIVVRVSWKDVLSSHIQAELLPQYLSYLFSVLLRIGSNPTSYVKIRASLLDLLKILSQRSDWATVTPERVEDLAQSFEAILKIRASLLDLLKMLSQRSDWSTVTPERVEDLAQRQPHIIQALVTTWTAYIDANHESPLVLTSLNTLIGSLNADQLLTALKVMEKTLHVYFNRKLFDC
ncbi:unnamed protein product [Cylicostephanus goldi]|uniref:Epg5-like central TPR repeats domain-containing protein n=1 Tax=Cylicostephanus goldi TaxID=71465 RepID=A0A3P7MUR7_CYLGO|nr:unnamed protein product [Cylicostephanus goldi]